MQLNALASAGATADERAPYVKSLKAMQNPDGSWSPVANVRGNAYQTGEALYALHVSGDVAAKDPVYQKGVQWLLRNQLADGTWFVPTRTTPGQPHFESGFPHGPASSRQTAAPIGRRWRCCSLFPTSPPRNPPRRPFKESAGRMNARCWLPLTRPTELTAVDKRSGFTRLHTPRSVRILVVQRLTDLQSGAAGRQRKSVCHEP